MTLAQLEAELLSGLVIPKPINFADAEVPTPSVPSSNVFTLANTPNPPISLHVYLNGVRLTAGQDFTLVGNTITIDAAETPGVNDVFVADYRF
jgi:hypothetical protein